MLLIRKRDEGGELHFWYHGHGEALCNVSILKTH